MFTFHLVLLSQGFVLELSLSGPSYIENNAGLQRRVERVNVDEVPAF